MIIHNKIKCNHCGDVIESFHVHDFKSCKCGRVSVDGGHEYCRRTFKEPTDYTELSEYVNDMKYKFFCNKDCEYYPCHKGVNDINCLFCFCPLYSDENCGGNFTVLSNGIKDCSNCVFPHIVGNYDKIIERLRQ